MGRYVVTQTCQYAGRVWNAGEIVDISATPPAEFFTATTQDPKTPAPAMPLTDRDGTLYFPLCCWEDKEFPFTQTKQGSNLKPDFDFTNIGLLFPQNDAAEKVYIIDHLQHSWKKGTPLKFHIHWQQSAATAVTWKLAYKLFNNGDAVPADFTTITAGAGVFTYTSGYLAQISTFPDIDTSAITGESAVLLFNLYREDNVTTGDVLAWKLDYHYLKDSLGSGKEYNK